MSSVIFRLITSLILFLFTASGFGQVEPKLYAGINPYIDKSFKSEVYGGSEIGAEVLRFKFLAPEVGFQFLSGQPDAVEDLDFDRAPPRLGLENMKETLKLTLFLMLQRCFLGMKKQPW